MKLTLMVAVALLGFAPAELSAQDAYRVLATSRTSTMQKEISVAAAGFLALAMTVGQTASGGQELVVITRRLLQ